MGGAGMRTILLIQGMHGGQAVDRVVDALRRVPGVHDAYVSLYLAKAEIDHDDRCDLGSLMRAVRRAGFHAEQAEEPRSTAWGTGGQA
jgi:copper chaperone CopZ